MANKYPTVEKVLADWAEPHSSEFEHEVEAVKKQIKDFCSQLASQEWQHLVIHDPEITQDGMGAIDIKLLLS